LQLIQNCAFRRITNIYKTTFTKVLQVKINVSFINVHLEKLIQKLIAIIYIQELDKIIDVAMLRIRSDLMSKKEQKLKLKIIFLQFKKKCEKNSN
jgi:broad-specificity NMP kinase